MKEQDVLRESELVLKSLLEIISNEQSALVKIDQESLIEIVLQKNHLLKSLEKYQDQLSQILQKDKSSKTQKIREMLTECQELNKQNRHVGHIGLNVITKSLDILQSAMHIESVKTYGPEGKNSGGPRKRNLGVV